MKTEARRVDAKECGKLMRRDLRRAFPGTKFRVRMSRGTGWGNYHIQWTDGPTMANVERVVGKYEGKTFDAMTDCPGYNPDVMESTESGLEMVKYAAGYVNCSRKLSEPVQAALLEHEKARWGDWDEIHEHERQRRLWDLSRRTTVALDGRLQIEAKE